MRTWAFCSGAKTKTRFKATSTRYPRAIIFPLHIAHVQVIVRGMYVVALAEGVHDTELVMMRDFYEQCAQETQAMASFRDVVDTPFDKDTAVAVINNDSL